MRRNYFMKSISIIFMLLAMMFSCDQPTDVGSNNSNQQNQDNNQNGGNTENENNKDDVVTTGKIVGKATYTNTANHAGIQVTLVSSDGIVAYDSQISSRSRSAIAVMKNVVTSKSGEYSFDNVKEGVYTIYASSNDSTEKAVLTNVVVQANQVVTAADLNLTATGSISGKVTIDGKENGNLGILVFVASTSYMSMTDDLGVFTISDVPAGADYQIVIMKGDYCTLWENVSVEAGKENKLGDKNITSQKSDASSFIWQGSSATPPANPEKYWAYFDTDDGCSYIYDGEKWTLLAQAGANGTNGTGGSGSIYSYTVNIDDINNIEMNKATGILTGCFMYFLTAEQVRLCQEAGGFNDKLDDKLYYYLTGFIPDTDKSGNCGVLGQLQNLNDFKTNFLNGIAATVTDTTLTITVDMAKIEQTQLTASIGDSVTKNDIVDLTGYRPYIGGLGDKTTNPDDFVAEGLMKMTPTATFPTDIQYVPVSCYKLTMYTSYHDSGSLPDNSFIFMGDDSFEFVFMNGHCITVYGGVEIDSLDKEIRLVDGGMISFTDGVLTDGKAYIATLIVKGDQEAYVKVTECTSKKEITATASDIADTISGLSAGVYAIKVTGSIDSDTVSDIGSAMMNKNIMLDLDLSGTTGLTEIPDYAFENTNLTNIIIPEGMTSIGDSVFSDCDNLTSINIPDSVAFISNSAFRFCNSLERFDVGANNQYYISSDNGKSLYNKDKTTLIAYPTATGDIIIPNGVTYINSRVFYDCSSLTNVTIPDSVTTIGYSAFGYCDNLTSVTIPDGVTEIADYTFQGCSNLKTVTIPAGVTYIGYCAFEDCDNLTTVNYKGSDWNWEEINIDFYDNSNKCLKSATINYNYSE